MAPYQVIEVIPDWPPPTTYDYELATVLDQDSNTDTLEKCTFSLLETAELKSEWLP